MSSTSYTPFLNLIDVKQPTKGRDKIDQLLIKRDRSQEAYEIDREPNKASKIMVTSWESQILFQIALFNGGFCNENLRTMMDYTGSDEDHHIRYVSYMLTCYSNDKYGYLDLLHKYLTARDGDEIQRGDIVIHEFSNGKNDSCFIWDTDKILYLDGNSDTTYGTISKPMKVITEFPTGYWNSVIYNNEYVYTEPDKLDILAVDFDVDWTQSTSNGSDICIRFQTSYGTREYRLNYPEDEDTKWSVITVRDQFNKYGHTHIIFKHYVKYQNQDQLVRHFLTTEMYKITIDREPPMLVLPVVFKENEEFLTRVDCVRSMVDIQLPKVLCNMVLEYVY